MSLSLIEWPGRCRRGEVSVHGGGYAVSGEFDYSLESRRGAYRGGQARVNERLGRLYTSHSTAIYRYISARVFDPDTAEDLTSEVFISAIKGINSYRYRGQPFLAWLYRIARNTVSSYQRTLLRRQSIASRGLLSNLFGRRQAPATGESDLPETGASDRESGLDVSLLGLRHALGTLNQAQREVIVCCVSSLG